LLAKTTPVMTYTYTKPTLCMHVGSLVVLSNGH